MGKQRRRTTSALMQQLRRERELATARLTPAERLREALELSEFCFRLAARGRELRVNSSPANNPERT